MREILFRGQTRRKGEKVRMDGTPVDSNWVYGGVFQGKSDLSIIYSYDSGEKFAVYADTIGQYTGLTDKNGKKIFEGDILESHYGYHHSDERVRVITTVVWFENGWCILQDEWDVYFPEALTQDGVVKNSVVIGNIHDNQELLKGGTGK